MASSVTHLAAMTMGSDGRYGTGETTARCGLRIPAREDGPYVLHSNLRLHTTCSRCIAVADFVPFDRSDPADVEAWLAT